MRTTALASIALAAGLLWCPAALGQETEQPGQPTAPAQAGPVLDVHQVVIPRTRDKLLSRGVLVQASCTPDCLLVVKLQLSPGVARKLGLRKRVIGSAVASASAGVPASVRARVRRSVRRPLSDYPGSPNLRVRIQALP